MSFGVGMLPMKNRIVITERTESLGYQVGSEAINHAIQYGEKVLDEEKRRIEAQNEPEILAGRAELCLLQKSEKELALIAGFGGPRGSSRTRRRNCFYHGAVALVLIVAGFFFLVLSFTPYRLGCTAYLYCLGIALITPFAMEKFLEYCGGLTLFRVLACAAVLTSLTAGLVLAAVRGNILIRQLSAGEPTVVLDDGPPTAQSAGDFITETGPLLQLALCLLAAALELSAGIALYEARRLSSEPEENAQETQRQLADVRERMITLVRQIAFSQNESAVCAARFWRDFHRAMVKGASRRSVMKFPALWVFLVALGLNSASAAPLYLIVAVDLSRTEAVVGQDNGTELAKNLAAVNRLLSAVPAGSHVTALGITADSFARPFVLMSARLSRDEGYFGDRLTAARRQVLAEWKKRSEGLQPRFSGTDICGALFVASQLFAQSPDARKVLVIYSDMRESVGADLETPAIIPGKQVLAAVEKKHLLAPLSGVEVYALGVHAAGKTPLYWASLREFWGDYFRSSGAALKGFFITRQLPRLEAGR